MTDIRHTIARPWIGVDLDGTLADHYWPEKGEYHPERIGDPVPAMVERVQRWIMDGHEVRIFTARVGPNGSAPHTAHMEDRDAIFIAIGDWTEKHIGTRLKATCTKDYNMVSLWDDRAVRVICNTGNPCCEAE